MPIISDASLLTQVEQVADILMQRQLKLVTAESCTGGWVAKCCTDLAGSSAWFDRGFVTYSNEAKQLQLDVSARLLSEYGAVSQPVAEAMSTGALSHSAGHISVALTGIAGPDGGSADKPVGTVWISWATGESRVKSEKFQFDGNRDAIRRQAVYEALSGIIKNARDS